MKYSLLLLALAFTTTIHATEDNWFQPKPEGTFLYSVNDKSSKKLQPVPGITDMEKREELEILWFLWAKNNLGNIENNVIVDSRLVRIFRYMNNFSDNSQFINSINFFQIDIPFHQILEYYLADRIMPLRKKNFGAATLLVGCGKSIKGFWFRNDDEVLAHQHSHVLTLDGDIKMNPDIVSEFGNEKLINFFNGKKFKKVVGEGTDLLDDRYSHEEKKSHLKVLLAILDPVDGIYEMYNQQGGYETLLQQGTKPIRSYSHSDLEKLMR